MRARIHGITRSGKTYFALWKMSQYMKQNKRDRYVVYDTSDDMYEDHLKDLGFDKTELTRKSPKEIDFYEILKEEPKQFFHIHTLPKNQLATYMNDLAGDVLDLGNTVMIIDEAYEVFNLNSETKVPNIASLVKSGAKEAIDLMTISQQPVDLAMTGRSQADTMYIFKMVKHVEKVLEDLPDKVTKEDITNLDKREFLVYNIYYPERGVGKGNTEGLEISL